MSVHFLAKQENHTLLTLTYTVHEHAQSNPSCNMLILPEGWDYSRRIVCLFARWTYPEHNLKTLGHNLFKLHTVLEGFKMECRAKAPQLCFALEISPLLENRVRHITVKL
jgi:hypothetical protein